MRNGDASSAPRYDDVYLSIGPNAQARVEIADSPVYANAREIVIQPSTSWSDNQIKVIVQKGALSSLSNSYLFVTDKDGNRNALGVPVK